MLEKYFLSKETIERLNGDHMNFAEKEAKRVFGPLYTLFKQKKKK